MSSMSTPQRPPKRQKINTVSVHLNETSTVQVFSNHNASILSVVSNALLKRIHNCTNLSIIKLFKTEVESIQACRILYSLDIIENNGIEKLKLPSVRNCLLSDLEELDHVDLKSAIDVKLDKLMSLRRLFLPSVINLTISNMSIRNKHHFMNLVHVELINTHGYEYDILTSPNLKTILLKNCSLKQICNLDGLDEIIIDQCESLRYIENVSNVKTLSIRNCPRLASMVGINSIQQMTVTCCNDLKRIACIEAKTLRFDSCYSLTSIPQLIVENLQFVHCPSVIFINMSSKLKELIVDHCISLEVVQFNNDTAFCYADLSIKIIGNNKIVDIKEWYADSLVIRDNSSLETIDSVYNVSDLLLIDCRELYSVSNVYIVNELLIESCPAIEKVVNVFGFTNLHLIDCESLNMFDMYLTNLHSVRINDCPELNLSISGSGLEELNLLNCGFVFVSNLSKHTMIDIANTRLLPDLKTNMLLLSTPSLNEEPVIEEAVQLRQHMTFIFNQSNMIKRYIRRYIDMNKYIRFRDMVRQDRICNCAICHDSMTPNTSFFTRCNHLFHVDCFRNWMAIRRSCPLCNRTV